MQDQIAEQAVTPPLTVGSIWHKWDLHIHSPLSALNNQFTKLADGLPDWEKYIKALSSLEDIPAIAITDYFTIEGYKHVLEAKHKGELPNVKLVLPNIEFRLDKLINTKGGYRRLNYHVLFSDAVSPKDIEEHFLQEIKFRYEAEPQNVDLSFSVRRQNLELLGQRLKSEHAAFSGKSDFEIGCMNATVDPTEIKRILQNKAQLFEGRYLILLPEEHLSLMDWDGQDHQTRKLLLQGADAILAKNPKTVKWALGGNTEASEKAFVKEFKSLKACVGGSDAHDLASVGIPDLDRYCWIKADLTFDGLKQILFEPKLRVYLGEQPPDLKNDYQVIDCVKITGSEGWFGNLTVPLNADLVSIIGPRGSGKSALAEMIALAGGSNLFRYHAPSPDTFIAKASKRSATNADTLVGTNIHLQWRDDHSSSATIGTNLTTPNPEEEIKYLPQKFVERLCAPENTQELEAEIERVVYQRHQKSTQSEASNFQELRRSATQALQARRVRLSQQIKTLNHSIAGYGEQIEGLASKKAELERKKLELAAVVKSAPSIPEANRNDVDKLSALQTQRLQLGEKIAHLNRQTTILDTVAARYEMMAADIVLFNKEVSELLKSAGVGDPTPYAIQGPPSAADDAIALRKKAIEEEIVATQGAKGANDSTTISGVDTEVAAIKTALSMTEGKQKEYEKNQADRKKLEIAISALERDVKEINDVIKPKRQSEQSERMGAFLDAIDLLGQEAGVLAQLYRPLHDALASANATANRLNFISKVVFDTQDHASRGMELFDRRRSFIREEETLRSLLTKYFDDLSAANFDRTETTKAFDLLLSGIKGTAPPLPEQLREKRSPKDFADWLFDIEPYSVTYALEYDKKDLKFLSPGEKGIVLLLLYLEAEEDDHRPLIIDQPDDNLDNLSIYPNLINYFRDRKLTRQIIIITHNPNLVVTTDSEQVVIGNFDGARTPKIQYQSGALEHTTPNPNVGLRAEVCRVLEGGKKAFRIREHRYDIQRVRDSALE